MEIKNARKNKYGTIDCEINHPVYGWIQFTASPDDSEEHGRLIHSEIEKLNLPDCVEPEITAEEKADIVRRKCDALLFETVEKIGIVEWEMMTEKEKQDVKKFRADVLAIKELGKEVDLPEFPVNKKGV